MCFVYECQNGTSQVGQGEVSMRSIRKWWTPIPQVWSVGMERFGGRGRFWGKWDILGEDFGDSMIDRLEIFSNSLFIHVPD